MQQDNAAKHSSFLFLVFKPRHAFVFAETTADVDHNHRKIDAKSDGNVSYVYTESGESASESAVE